MAINFPSSPSINDVHTENSLSWRYNGNAWLTIATSNIESVVATGSTEPRSLSDRFADVVNPLDFGASPTASSATNDIAFAAIEAAAGDKTVDLLGEEWTVTEPRRVNAVNGYWKVENFDESLDACLPVKDTLERTVLKVDGGKRTLGWSQGTTCSYNGVLYSGYHAAEGHEAGALGWTQTTSLDGGKSVSRFEAVDFGLADDVAVFGQCIIPPSGAYTQAHQVVLAHVNHSGGGTEALKLYIRDIAQYQQDAGTEVARPEGSWQEVTFNGNNLGTALRSATDSAYSVTTSGVPSVAHSLTYKGDSVGGVSFGFHGLSGSNSGTYICDISNDIRDLVSTINFVGRLGALPNGTEPAPTWYHKGSGSAHLLTFIRSEGVDYPSRFTVSTYSQSGVQNADIQECPWGNEFALKSPILSAVRPRTKAGTDGWIATSNTVGISDLSDSDELHFTFTGRRDSGDGVDGAAGTVWLYWGSVSKGVGDWLNLWERAKIVPIMPLYFANSNDNDGANQVGVGDIAFTDTNTLVITASNEVPAVTGDEDESHMLYISIKLRDGNPINAQERTWDDGTGIPVTYQKALEHLSYSPTRTSFGPKRAQQIDNGMIRFRSSNTVLNPESETSDVLDTIEDAVDGDVIVLRSNSSNNSLTITEGGNITLDGGNDFLLDNARDRLTLMYDEGSSEWTEISRANNAT